MQRRQFLGLLSLPALAMLTGSAAAQEVGVADGEFTPVPTWTGQADARPAADSDRLNGLQGRVVYIATDTGAVYYIDSGDGSWTHLPVELPKYVNSNLPTGFPEGALVHDEDRGTPVWYDGSMWDAPSFVNDVSPTPQNVGGADPETAIFSPSIRTDSLIQNRTYDIDVFGNFTTASSSDTFTLRVKIGGTTVATITSTAAKVSGAPFEATTVVAVESDGPSGQIETFTKATFDNEDKDVDNGASAVDTTTATAVEVTVEWAGSDAGNSLTRDIGRMKEMG
jgi:hypothetical protein